MDRFVFSLSYVFAFPDTNKDIRKKKNPKQNYNDNKSLPTRNYFAYYLDFHEFWIERRIFSIIKFKINVTFPTELY